jgi:hypothetical protein
VLLLFSKVSQIVPKGRLSSQAGIAAVLKPKNHGPISLQLLPQRRKAHALQHFSIRQPNFQPSAAKSIFVRFVDLH